MHSLAQACRSRHWTEVQWPGERQGSCISALQKRYPHAGPAILRTVFKKGPSRKNKYGSVDKIKLGSMHTSHARTHTRLHARTHTYAHTHTLTHIHRCFWEPFRLGNSAAVNSVKRLISGVNPELGFRFKKTKPLLRLVFIHTENRNVTFARTKIYAGFLSPLCVFTFVFLLFQNIPLHTWYRFC